jgi:hypothetical protein
VHDEAPAVPVDSHLPAAPADPKELERLAEQFGLVSPIRRLQRSLGAGAA